MKFSIYSRNIAKPSGNISYCISLRYAEARRIAACAANEFAVVEFRQIEVLAVAAIGIADDVEKLDMLALYKPSTVSRKKARRGGSIARPKQIGADLQPVASLGFEGIFIGG